MGRNAQKRRARRARQAIDPEEPGRRGLPGGPPPDDGGPRPHGPLWLEKTVVAGVASARPPHDDVDALCLRLGVAVTRGEGFDRIAELIGVASGTDAVLLASLGGHRRRRLDDVAGRQALGVWRRVGNSGEDGLLDSLTDAVVDELRAEGIVRLDDAPRDRRLPSGATRRPGSLVLVALRDEEDEVFGALVVGRREVRGFVDRDAALLRRLGEEVGLDVAQAELIRSGLTDPQTGLFGRQALLTMLHRELDRQRRRGLPTSALVIDIDHLDVIEADHGEDGIDAVVGAVAERLVEPLRAAELGGRLSGGQLLLLIEGDLDAAETAAARLLEAVASEPVVLGDATIDLRLSAGVAALDPDEDGLSLLDRALGALAEARSLGGARIARSEPEPPARPE